MSSLRSFLLLVSVLLAPLAFRCALVWDARVTPGMMDVRGAFIDVSVSLLVFVAVVLLARAHRVAALLAVLFWSLLQHANFENVLELDSLASLLDVGFLADRTFLLGSALRFSQPWISLPIVLLAMVSAWFGAAPQVRPRPIAAAAIAMTGLAAAAFWPEAPAAAHWRQTSFVRHNAMHLLRQGRVVADSGPDFIAPPAAMQALEPSLGPDLEGESLLSEPGRARNVLVIIIEGLAGGFVESFAVAQGMTGLLQMDHTQEAANRGLSYPNFLVHNRKTNRGLYSMLCGEPPALIPGTPKMTQHVERAWQTCLPEVLQNHGYATAFIQAAPLGFMMKDQFAVRAGFDRAYGYEHFDRSRASAVSIWGMDDMALFEQSLDIIEALQAGPDPWFASILTVGTHHPYVYPKDFAVKNLGRTQAAFLYADAALGFLLRELESRGVLEDTLVLITSDESRGVKPESGATPLGLDRPTLEFSQNWGILIALQPEGLVEERRGLFAQMDLALSVVDYLGLPDEAGNFMGRSVFRRYDEGRYMPFGNTNMFKVGLIHPSGTITRCRFARDTCVSRMHPKGRFFAPSHKRAVRSTPEEQELTMALARASHVESLSGVHDRTIPLVSQDRMAVERSRYFHAGPFITLDPGQWIEVEYELEVYGESGAMKFTHKLQESKRWAEDPDNRVRGKLVNQRVMIKPGQTLYLRYSVVPEPDDEMQGIKLTSKGVRGRSNPPFEVSFRKAVLRVSSDPDHPPVGVTILDKRIEPSDSSRLRSRGSEGAALPGLD